MENDIRQIQIGLAREPHHQWLQNHGIIPVLYHGDTEKNINDALKGKKVDTLIDSSGEGYGAMAVYMGIEPERINTIIDFEAAEKYNVKTQGNSAAATKEVLAEIADLADQGKLEVPIAKTYPLSDVQQAYEELAGNHTQSFTLTKQCVQLCCIVGIRNCISYTFVFPFRCFAGVMTNDQDRLFILQ